MKEFERGDLVTLSSDGDGVPLYLNDNISDPPTFCKTGDTVLFLGTSRRVYAIIQHPVAGYCTTAKHRLRAV